MRGFTLIELLLVVAATGIIAAGGVQLSRTLVSDAAGEGAVRTVAVAFREAQRNSVLLVHDASWGVRVSSVSAVVFEGDSWESRLEDSDHKHAFSRTASGSDVGDIAFPKGSFEPSEAASFSLPFGSDVWQFVVGVDGIFSYGIEE